MVGQTLGSYRIVSEIGKGGMGVVYLAEHALLGRKAAVKLLRSDVAGEQVERFFNEAKAAATLHHPGLVEVFDFGHHTDGRGFIVMEFLVGESLAERLERDPRLPVPIACTIARHVANALAVAHNEGIIHRDLKPGNIFLVPDAESPAGVRTKVLDFGIAKLARNTDARSVKTHSGAVIGTPRYMSPEQCKNAREVDGRADIYSLGCILFEMLLGVAPFDYDSWAELVSAHLHETPPRPSELDPAIPADVETLVMKMLSKLPQDRHRSMEELSQSLEVILRTHASDWPVRSTPTHGIRKVTRENTDPTMPASGDRRIVTGQQPALGKDDTVDATPAPAVLTAARAADVQKDASASRSAAPAPKKVPWLAIGLAGGGVVALAGAAVLVLAIKSKSQPREPEVVVVREEDRGSRGSAQEHSVPPPPVAVDAGTAVQAPATPDAGVKTTKPGAIDTAALTRTFSKQTTAITGCFHDHPNDAGDAELSVRFQIDASGKVRTAEVLPANVAGTPLGACLATVAKSTNFGPQAKALTFRVPIYSRGQ